MAYSKIEGKLGEPKMRAHNTVEGKIEEIVKMAVSYIIQEKIEALGIGERLHGSSVLRNVMIPYLLPVLSEEAKFKTLLFEFIFKDIPTSEWDILHTELSKYSVRDPTNIRLNALNTLLLNNQFRLPKLYFNLNQAVKAEYRDTYQNDLLFLITKAYDLGVKLYGMIGSNEITGTDLEIMLRIKAGGEQEALRLLKEGRKFIVYGGDAHVNCRALQPPKLYPNASRTLFGNTLFSACRYLNLTIVDGTVNALDIGETAYRFYRGEFETLKPGWARISIIRLEDEHKMLLLHKDPLIGR